MGCVRLNLGYDRGNERTNAAALSELNKIVEIDLSSLVAEGNLVNYRTVRKGSGASDGITSLHPNEMYVTYEGITYFLGDFAMQGDHPTNGYSDLNRYTSKHTKISLMACVAQLASKVWPYQSINEIEVNLVMGVPIQAYQSESKKIIDALKGTYTYTYNGKEYTVFINSVRVFMEGAGAAIYHGLDSSASIGIVDSGSWTTNILRFDGTKASARECASFGVGVGTVTKRLNTWFEQEYDRELSALEQQNILRAYLGQRSYPDIWVEGKQANGTLLHQWMQQAVAETGDDRNTRIAQVWQRSTIKSFKAVLHVGGGAYYFHSSLQQLIKSASIVDVAEKANARGYAVLAHQIAQRQAAQKGA